MNSKRGVRKEYYPNDKLEVESNYKNGERDGITRRYYESGELEAEWHQENYIMS
jgi:antitoxin component YwqK of YwqJK toxin-antitoxin module